MTEQNKPALRRVLGVPDGIAIVVGITIGAGIYSTPQIIATYMSSFSEIMLLWGIVGIFVFVGGLIYSELGTRLPDTGGEYVYISRAFGPHVGFIFGWAQLFIIRTSPAAGLAIIATNYLGYFVEMSATTHTLVALTVIAALGALNYVGIKQASGYQKISTAFKVGGLFLLAITGLILVGGKANLLGTSAPPTGQLGSVGNIVAALILVVFSHTGFERLGYPAGEMKNPRKVIPLSMFIGLCFIIFIYVAVNFIYFRILGIEGLRESTIVASDVAIKLFGEVGAGLTAILVMVSATGSINGTIMAAPRVYYAMAKDRLFFKWFDYIHPKYLTPSRAIIAHCLWGGVILLIRGTFENIIAGMVFTILIFYGLSAAALLKLRAREETGGPGYRMPFYPVLPGLYLSGIVALIIFRAYYEFEKSLIDLAFIASGFPFGLIWWRKRN